MTQESGALHVDETGWAEVVLGSPVPVFVKFGAHWCTPCRVLDPVVDELAVAYDGRVRVVSVDSDKTPGLLDVYRIESIPTLLLLDGGTEKRRIIGARPKPELRREIDALLDAS